MKPSLYLCITGCVFGLVSLGHLMRALLGVSIIAAGWEVPMSLSWVGFPMALLLSLWAFTLLRKA